MRDLNRIILHCSATREGKDFSADTIRDWHVKGNGWSDIGYHWVIRLDGSIEVGRPLEKSGAHTKGHNKDSVGVCYIGGCDADGKPKDTMNPEQEKAWRMIVLSLRTLYGDLTIHGHNEFANKACPSFIVKEKFADMY
jgi:N-acetylmuramoyl-L-alanine amidase